MPKETKKTFCVKVNNRDVDSLIHKDRVWHAIVETLVHRYCYYKVMLNASIDQIEKTDYREFLEGAEIQWTYIARYPSREQKLKKLAIYGKVENVENRGLKCLRFCEMFGAESFTITEPEYPLLEVFQGTNAIIFGLHLTEKQKEDFINTKDIDVDELEETTPEDLAVYKLDTDVAKAKPKETKRTFYVKFNGWEDSSPIQKDKVWHTIVETLVHRHCSYRIESNISIDQIEKTDYSGILEGAEIQLIYISRYPSKEQHFMEFAIFGRGEDVQKRGLKHLRFCETYGAERLIIEEWQEPLINVFESPDVMIIDLHLTMKQKDDLIDALKVNACELKEITPEELQEHEITEENVLQI